MRIQELLSWNAFVVASEIDGKYLKVAQNLADFLLDNFYQKYLQRVQIEDQTSQRAIFEDYAYFADGLIDLYDATGHKKYLTTAQKLTDEAIYNFWDKKNFGFKISNNKRINNNKEIYDGAIFNANGVAYSVLNKLSTRTQDKKYQQFAQQLLLSFSTKIHKNPSAYASIVKNYSDKQQGILANTVYAYDGRIKIQSSHNQVILNIEKSWHINANKVLQKSLIATQLVSDNIKTINYPQEKRINLGFSKEKLAIYDKEITLNLPKRQEIYPCQIDFTGL
ncbi:Thymidylate kinase [uncultured Candidatus Thioglobus sp.]|nr:Thymidylate kinase [uncultured Candidatus Thioglobus sp.]